MSDNHSGSADEHDLDINDVALKVRTIYSPIIF